MPSVSMNLSREQFRSNVVLFLSAVPSPPLPLMLDVGELNEDGEHPTIAFPPPPAPAATAVAVVPVSKLPMLLAPLSAILCVARPGASSPCSYMTLSGVCGVFHAIRHY